ncbi:MAG: methyltransferase domain-containing protein [Burkholderiales bacterium]
MHKANAAAQCSIPCNLCGSTDAEQIRSKDRHGNYLRSVICRQCGLVWTDPRPTPEQVREFYAHEYRLDYKGTYQPKAKHTYRSGKVAVDRFQRLRPILKPGFRVLDVGAGSGEVVYVLRAMGYEASGFEPNEGYARYAAEVLGLPVRQGFWQDVAIQPESQDMVTMFHTVEHLESPFDVMRHARQWLRPQGLLLVEVPNGEAVCQQPHTQFHRGHLYHFNLATLEMMARRVGYAVVSSSVSSDGGNITVVSQKTDTTPSVSAEIPGNYERVGSILRRHTAFRHVFSRHPYVRPFRKFAARLEEQRSVRSHRPAKEVLDTLISDALQPNRLSGRGDR